MRLIFLAATALSVTGTALAYQTAGADMDASVTPPEATATTTTIDPVTATPAPVNLQTFAGMGGPYEEVYGSGSVNLTPRPAEQNYPPCDPGPGDDNCIQLYERGVRRSYAQWVRAHDARPAPNQLAMGGPEPSAPRRTQVAAHDPRCIEHDEQGGEARGM